MGKINLLLLLFMMFNVQAFAQEEVIWMHNDYPPNRFLSEPYFGEGDCDSAMLSAQEHLSEDRHILRNYSFGRFLKLLKSKPNYCTSCLLKTPQREEFVLFSKPFNYSENNMLITRASDAKLYSPYLDSDGKIDLEALLQSKKVVLATNHGRSYGAYIDSILVPFRDTEAITTISSHSSLQLMFRRLVTMQPYDALLGYSTELIWHSGELKIPLKEFAIYQIKGIDDFDSKSYVYFACSKSETGERIIATIDANINDIRKTSMNKYRHWLDEEARERHIKFESLFYRKNP
ncbi:hypothetical protein [Desulfogranum marinum]|uniref:hypothetical protein n=1 Tax=Desulfogranum marinum TaxID=453220 RepID=UPI0029C905E6|nr:hypothetical protein [Desulfogranum marinum]